MHAVRNNGIVVEDDHMTSERYRLPVVKVDNLISTRTRSDVDDSSVDRREVKLDHPSDAIWPNARKDVVTHANLVRCSRTWLSTRRMKDDFRVSV
jgi:hypothetical protein